MLSTGSGRGTLRPDHRGASEMAAILERFQYWKEVLRMGLLITKSQGHWNLCGEIALPLGSKGLEVNRGSRTDGQPAGQV